ncbi:MAG: threonine synthase [candidate division KSB1 bacterium]|nr:threonine synthase [candidate division KSB1 bacterium]MDZ7393603.1 threonine synthase [candidate division KSB1 bacterium]MDZ7413040.1 threonine synthase [candidate division KSB1 bacterium]
MDSHVTFLQMLRCARCGAAYPSDQVLNLCRCGSPLLAEYDLQAARRRLRPEVWRSRPPGVWRYHELLPVQEAHHVVSLGEGGTPLFKLRRLGASVGLSNLFVKDEGQNPTGSFKARGLAVAVSKARELGVTRGAIPSAGNAGGALAAYAARVGLRVDVFMPADVPEMFKMECRLYGATVHLIDGLISDCGRAVQERQAEEGWFNFSTFKEPYRLEGKKTMGYELAEQFEWQLPEVIVYPTGGGTGLVGMWRAFQELCELGWLRGSLPRMVAVQAKGCAPIVSAFRAGAERAEAWPQAQTVALGLRVPQAIGDFLMLRVLRESNGTAIAVDDRAIVQALRELACQEGLFACPEGAATWAACKQLVSQGWIRKDEHVVLFNTGSGMKYAEVLGSVTSAEPA